MRALFVKSRFVCTPVKIRGAHLTLGLGRVGPDKFSSGPVEMTYPSHMLLYNLDGPLYF